MFSQATFATILFASNAGDIVDTGEGFQYWNDKCKMLAVWDCEKPKSVIPTIPGGVCIPAVTQPPVNTVPLVLPSGATFTNYFFSANNLFTGGQVVAYSINGVTPPGLTFNTVTGVLSGTPTTAGDYTNISFTATNASGNDTSNTDNLLVSNGTNAVDFTLPFDPPDGIVGEAYSYDVATLNTGGAATIYEMVGTLPDGLSLNTSTGLISGIPTVMGTFSSLVVNAGNAEGNDSTSVADIDIAIAYPVMGTLVLPPGTVGTSYTFDASALNTGGAA